MVLSYTIIYKKYEEEIMEYILSLFSNNDKTVNETIVPFNKEQIETIPREIWMEVFSFLSALEIGTMSLVCHEWKDITDHNHIFKWRILNYYGRNVVDNFAPLIVSQKISWKEVPHYHHFADCFSRIINWEFNHSYFLRAENPQIPQSKEFHDLAQVYFPRHFINYGNYNFSICNLFDIKITEIESNKEIILEGDGQNRISHISVENNFIFCLRTDGMIVQWNYQKGEIVQEIQSEYIKGNNIFENIKKKIENGEKYSDYKELRHNIANSFYVKNGYIIINYYWYPRLDHILEIIDYSNQNRNQLINYHNRYLSGKTYIDQNILYILKRNDIFIFDIKNKYIPNEIKIHINSSKRKNMANDFCIQKNIIYATDTDKKMHIINKKNRKEIKKYSLPKCFWSAEPIAVVKNILFGFQHHTDRGIASDGISSDGISVFDLNKKRRIGIVSVKFDESKRIIKDKFKLLEILITMVK